MNKFIIIFYLALLSLGFFYCLQFLTDRLPDPVTVEHYPPAMARIDSLQGLTAIMKEHALDRLSKMGTDSVEMIIQKAGY